MSCGASGRHGDFCRAYRPLRLTEWGVEGPADGGLVLVKGRTVFEGCSHAAEGPAEEIVRRFGSIVAAR